MTLLPAFNQCPMSGPIDGKKVSAIEKTISEKKRRCHRFMLIAIVVTVGGWR